MIYLEEENVLLLDKYRISNLNVVLSSSHGA